VTIEPNEDLRCGDLAAFIAQWWERRTSNAKVYSSVLRGAMPCIFVSQIYVVVLVVPELMLDSKSQGTQVMFTLVCIEVDYPVEKGQVLTLFIEERSKLGF
jgi:hypothetical protein